MPLLTPSDKVFMNYSINIPIYCILFLFIFNFSDVQSQSFIQKVDYNIQVKLDDKKNTLSGHETITYHNNSPDTLHYIYIHLYPNAYSSHETAFAKQNKNIGNGLFCFATEEEKGYIDNLDFTTKGEKLQLIIDEQNPDIGKLLLKNPLAPNSIIEIETPFYVKIPYPFSRMGVSDGVYQITQWYPKAAVYDKNGWHPLPYLDIGEFYADFGHYRVSIDIPASYVVASSGVLSSESTEERNLTDSLIQESKNFINGKIKEFVGFKNRSGRKTLIFTQDSIHDFAWFASKDFLVDELIFKIPQSGKSIRALSFFHPSVKKHWKLACLYQKNAVLLNAEKYYSYPFSEIKAVAGSQACEGGMEYPCISVNGPNLDYEILESIIAHEAGHNFFQGIIATNERDFPWMDESINSFTDICYQKSEAFIHKNLWKQFYTIDNFSFSYFNWYNIAGRGFSKEISLSNNYNDIEYYSIVYERGSAMFYYLQKYLSTKTFNNCMKEYFRKHAFAHPYPKDLQSSFEDISKQDLSWFFDSLLHTKDIPDFSFSNFNKKTGKLRLKNHSNIPLSVPIAYYKKDSLIELFFSPVFTGEIELSIPEKANYAIIDPEKILFEKRYDNNRIYFNGLFKKRPRIGIDIYSLTDKADRNNIHLYPLASWTQNSGILPGIYISTQVDRPHLLHFQAMPMFAYKQKQLVGEGKITLNKYYNSGKIRQFQAFTSIKSYFFPSSNEFDFRFLRYEAGFNLTFHNASKKSMLIHSFTAKVHYSEQDNLIYIPSGTEYVEGLSTRILRAVRIKWIYDNQRNINPLKKELKLDFNDQFARIQGVLSGKIYYNSPKKYFSYRIFAGSYIFAKQSFIDNFDGRIGISGIRSQQDIFLDHWFIGRNNNSRHFLEQQTFINQGGFYTNIIAGKNWNWASSISVKNTLPFDAPFQLYGSIGIYPSSIDNKISTVYEAGIIFSPLPGIIEIAFPIALDKNSNETLNLNTDNYLQKIRFIINFEKLNIHKWLDHPNIQLRL